MKGANLEDPDLPPVVLYQGACRSTSGFFSLTSADHPHPQPQSVWAEERHSFVFGLLLVSQVLSVWKRLWVSYQFPGDFVWTSFWGCHTVWELSPSEMKTFKRSRKKKYPMGGPEGTVYPVPFWLWLLGPVYEEGEVCVASEWIAQGSGVQQTPAPHFPSCMVLSGGVLWGVANSACMTLGDFSSVSGNSPCLSFPDLDNIDAFCSTLQLAVVRTEG